MVGYAMAWLWSQERTHALLQHMLIGGNELLFKLRRRPNNIYEHITTVDICSRRRSRPGFLESSILKLDKDGSTIWQIVSIVSSEP